MSSPGVREPLSFRNARAERMTGLLISLYPREWRARYGEEFAEVLADEFAERPHAPRRTLDIVRCAITEQLVSRGASGDRALPATRLRVATAITALACAPFLLLALALWSQLAIGWRWADPPSSAIHGAMTLMTAAIAGLALVTVISAIPIVPSVLRALAHQPRRLVFPLTLAALGAAGIYFGSVHFGRSWPGTGATHWAGQGLVPSGQARMAWAATLWITSYWAHPDAMGAFPGGRVLWMLASPLAWVSLLTGLALAIRRSGPLSTRVLRLESFAGAAAAALMIVFLAGACAWLFAAPHGDTLLFRTGVIDAVAVSIMASVMVLAAASARRALSARRSVCLPT